MATLPRNENEQGREAFFARIVQQHARLLYRVAHTVLRNPADAEDAVGDAVLKLLRTGAWQNLSNERAFLTRTVWRTALDRFNDRAARTRTQEDLPDFADDRPDPERSALHADQHVRLHAMIDRLPADLRDPLLLSAVQEPNSREIGEVLNLPEGTVRTRLMRARSELKAQFGSLYRMDGREMAAKGVRQ